VRAESSPLLGGQANDDDPSPAEGQEIMQEQNHTHCWVWRPTMTSPAQRRGRKQCRNRSPPTTGYGG